MSQKLRASLTIICGLMVIGASFQNASAAERPNVVVIMADDQ